MTIKSIKFDHEVDNTPDALNRRGELDQGDTYMNYRIYVVENEDGTTQYLQVGVEYDSYGSASTVDTLIKIVKPTTKTVTVFE